MTAVLLLVAAGWFLLALVVALIVGAGIRLADQIDAAVSDYAVEIPDEDVTGMSA